jgi:hypothetical protein
MSTKAVCWPSNTNCEAPSSGLVADRTAVERNLGLSRAQATRLLDLILLTPDIQDVELAMKVDSAELLAERTQRAVVHAGPQTKQRVAFPD